MTEDEAKTKWCPKVEHRGLGKCIASGCMAWRWDGEVIWSEMSKRWLAKDVPADAKTNAGLGHCGLAGRP